MNVAWKFEIWGSGNFTESVALSLNTSYRYFVETYLTKKNGDDYSHAYILQVCRGSGPILCGVSPENPGHSTEFLPAGSSRVIVALKNTGGSAASAGVVYRL